MSITSKKIAMKFVGSAMLAGVVIVMTSSWLKERKEGEYTVATEGSSAMEAPESAAWPLPTYQSRDRSGRELLELVGVLVGSGEEKAMIRVKDGETRIYRIGDLIADRRELMEIHQTHVLLRNAGRVERLRISGGNSGKVPSAGELEEFANYLKARTDVSESAADD